MTAVVRWSGREARALREARRMSVRAFAAHLGFAVASVTNWEKRGQLARLRGETQEILDADLSRAGDDVRARFQAALAETAAPTASDAAQQLQFPSIRLGNGDPLMADDEAVTDVMRAFRIADSRLGGAPLYSAVIAYLRTHIAPRLVDEPEVDADTSFDAAASMLEMAGWMAHDRGDDHTAKAHFNRASAFAATRGNVYLRAHVLGSMSHLAAHLGQPHHTIQLAQQGQGVLRDAPPRSPTRARLLALEARGAAGSGEHARSLELLRCAEAELANANAAGEPSSPWVSHYDHASLASDAGRCLRRLGDLPGARQQAECVIALRPAFRARSRGLGHLTLATVLAAQGTIDEAAAAVEQALDLDLPLHSAPIASGLRAVHDALTPYRTDTAVAGVHTRLANTIESSDSASGRRRSPRTRVEM